MLKIEKKDLTPPPPCANPLGVIRTKNNYAHDPASRILRTPPFLRQEIPRNLGLHLLRRAHGEGGGGTTAGMGTYSTDYVTTMATTGLGTYATTLVTTGTSTPPEPALRKCDPNGLEPFENRDNKCQSCLRR